MEENTAALRSGISWSGLQHRRRGGWLGLRSRAGEDITWMSDFWPPSKDRYVRDRMSRVEDEVSSHPQAQGTVAQCRWLQDTEEVRWLEPVPGQMMGKQREELETGWPRCISSRNGGSWWGSRKQAPLSFRFSPSMPGRLVGVVHENT